MTSRQIWRWCLLLPVGWWTMMAVHELGHVLGCYVSGATIDAVILWPWTISATLRSDSPAPLIDTWAGPVLGMLVPVLMWAALRRHRFGTWIGTWAGWCLVANGVYLGLGWDESAGDAADLRHLGTPVWLLVLVGGTCTGLGLWVWHLLLRHHRMRIHAQHAA